MSDEQWRAFISQGTRTGKLATVRVRGSSHVVPLWFALDGDELVFQTEKNSVRGRNLVRDPRYALAVDDAPPYAFAVLHGHARNGGTGIINIYGRNDKVTAFDGIAD